MPSTAFSPDSQEFPFSVAIVGGGIAGLTLAIALLERNVKVDIYEQAPAYGEIGAGVAFSPNAIQAMKLCSTGVYEAFAQVATKNQAAEKQKIWFDWLDGYNHSRERDGAGDKLFQLGNSLGGNAVHRAHFLGAMVKLIPRHDSHFHKHLDNIVQEDDGKMALHFQDGTIARADAVIGCDGIKSRVRQILVGRDHPSARPVYTHKYAYRGLIPMDKAVEAIGDENARNSKMHMGPDGHVLTFPVNHGKTMNVVAFRHNPDPWPDASRLTLPSHRDTALSEFRDWGDNVSAILSMLTSDTDCWGLFDLGDHPVPFYAKGRVCISGDAAHATTPHHGAGAGFCIEDSAVMAGLLVSAGEELKKDQGLQKSTAIEAAFAAFDASRRPRTQWLVQSSRRVSDLYEWRADGVGRDAGKIHKELEWRCNTVWQADITEMVEEARRGFSKQLNHVRSSTRLAICS